LPLTSPIFVFLPDPLPTLIETAPFPRVFQGIFGLSLTRCGKPMMSKPLSTSFSTTTIAV